MLLAALLVIRRGTQNRRCVLNQNGQFPAANVSQFPTCVSLTHAAPATSADRLASDLRS